MMRRRLPVVLAACALLAAGCGLKPDVSERVAAAGGAGGFDGTGGTGTAAGGTRPGGATGTATGGAGTSGAGTAAGGGTGTGSGAAGGGTATGGDAGTGGEVVDGGGGAAVEGDRTGITDTEIVIGIHAPVTGAAPFPQNSFEAGKDIYFQFINAQGGIHGRQVRVVFRDDRFDPRSAVAACREMVEDDQAFLLIGGGGSDQIGACADYAASVGVPYLSGGVQTSGLDALSNYFALSMTYAQQAPLVAQLARNAGGDVALVVAEGENLDDYFAAQQAALTDLGLNVLVARRIPKSTSTGDALNLATELNRLGAETVVFNASPVSFLNVAQAAAGQQYRPRYLGPGVTNGLNTVATIGCSQNAIAGAQFLSPFPQLDAIDGLDPDFRSSYQQFAGSAPDDLGIALWGLDKLVAAVFQAAGPDVSRQSFIALLESGQPFQTGVFPPVTYGPGNHFGGSQVHLLTAECTADPRNSRFVTTATFASGF